MGFDKVLSKAGFVLGALLAILLFFVGAFLYATIAAALVSICLLWLRYGSRLSIESFEVGEAGVARVAFALFAVAAIAAICVILSRSEAYSRPIIFFFLLSALPALTIIEIVSDWSYRRPGLILCQILLILVLAVLSEQILFPSVVGLDPASEQAFANSIGSSGTIPSGNPYSNLPFSDLSMVILSSMALISYKATTFLAISLPSSFLEITFTYLVGRRLYNQRIGLAAGLIVSIASYPITFGWWETANTFAMSLAMALFILLLSGNRKEERGSKLLLLVLISGVTLSHAIVTAQVLFVLLGLLLIPPLAYAIYGLRTDRIVSPGMFVWAGLTVCFWWVFQSNDVAILIGLIKSGFSLNFLSSGSFPLVLHHSLQVVPWQEVAWNNIGLVTLFALGLIGCLYTLSKSPTSKAFGFALVALAVSGVTFASLVIRLDILNARWFYLAELMMSIPASLILVRSSVSSRIRPQLLIVVAILFLIALNQTTNPISNIDNNTFSPATTVRTAFTQPEFTAAQFVSGHWQGKISSDLDFATNPSSSVFYNYYGVPLERIVSLDQSLLSGNYTHDGTLKIIRTYVLLQPFAVAGGTSPALKNVDVDLSNHHFDLVYNNPESTVWL